MHKRKNSISVIFLLLSLSLTSCTKSGSHQSYEQVNAGIKPHFAKGIIISKQPFIINTNQNSLPTDVTTLSASRAVSSGNLAGSLFATAVVTAITSGIESANIKKLEEYVIQLSTGKKVSVLQDKGLTLKVGQSVIVEYGVKAKIIPDPNKG